MDRKTITMTLLAVATCVGFFVVVRHEIARPAIEDLVLFQNTTNIIFAELGWSGSDKQIIVTDPEELRRFTTCIHLRRKYTCACRHYHIATFLGSSGQLDVSFCNHCFDLLDRENPGSYELARRYRMPPGFYDEFQRQVKRQTNEQWHVLAP